MSPTPCETCEHVHPATRKSQPYQWQCMRFPRVAGLDPVAPTLAVVLAPYNRCSAINLGHCPLWTVRREAPAAAQVEAA